MIEKVLQNNYFHSLDENKQKLIHELLNVFESNKKLYLDNQRVEIIKRRIFRDSIAFISAISLLDTSGVLSTINPRTLLIASTLIGLSDLVIAPNLKSIQKKEYEIFRERNEKYLAHQIHDVDKEWRKNNELPKDFPLPQFIKQFNLFKLFKTS